MGGDVNCLPFLSVLTKQFLVSYFLCIQHILDSPLCRLFEYRSEAVEGWQLSWEQESGQHLYRT